MKTFYPIIAIFMLLLHSCGSIVPQQPHITNETPLDIPKTKGIVRIPLEINLEPYFKQADKSIDNSFKGAKQECDGVSFDYFFKRQPIVFNGALKTLSYRINGEYKINVNYCAQCASAFGSDKFCITPRVYVSCGVGEPLRKIAINFESSLAIEPNYLLNSTTKLTKVEAIDPCNLSFLRYDASEIIEKEIGTFLKEMESEIDGQIAKVDLKSPINEAWKSLQAGMEIPGMGFLYFRPSAIAIEPIIFDQQKAKIIVAMELSPILSTNMQSYSSINLPFLTKLPGKEDFNIPILTLASYDSLNSILKTEVAGTVVPFKKKKIIINEAKALGPVGSQLLFRIEFSGSKKGTLFLLGTPTYDAKNKEISFPDLTFDIRTKDAILKSAKWLFDKKLTEAFRKEAKYDLTAQLETARIEIEKQLNNQMEYSPGQKVSFSGQLKNINFSQIQVGPSEIRVVIDLKGNLSLKL